MITVRSNVTRYLLDGETPMFWIDIETTGLDPQEDIILEVGLKVTNQNLLELARYTSLVTSVLPHPVPTLAKAPQVVQEMHRASGLTSAIEQLCNSEIAHNFWPEKVELQARDFLVNFLDNTPIEMPAMCGSSVHFDREFLRIHMPKLHEFFGYRNRDVSSIKEFCALYNPRVAGYLKAEQSDWTKVHRPQEDLDASIRELKFYLTEFLMVDDSVNLEDSHDPAQLPLF